MSASISSALTTTPSPVAPVTTVGRSSKSLFTSNPFTTPYHRRCRRHCHHPFLLRVKNESKRTELSPERTMQKSEADKIVDGMDFGELCNEFECISSPLVESTARQLVRDILELREGNRSLGTYAVSVKYKDPVRSFSGREKYKRPLWITSALENPSVVRKQLLLCSSLLIYSIDLHCLCVHSISTLFNLKTVQEMVMLSTSVLSIKWTIRGKPKSFIANVGGDLIVKINSKFTLNQISGQAGKDLADLIKNLKSRISTAQENLEIYPDPSADPTKFFQRDDNFQGDLYQIALFLAILYFVVQFLRTTL
ncbi:hypothetical protein Pint_21249 [Pistacia integerrima]|uniref:Uncharacterized protein n=1 Tax=Pistacia integerrima TaxID=434235 RepID=A0ACC0XFU0_9ROSI|nr:hypothetical protein Pint_21249 [Pistacia integerrima]